jgi:hypothetical protein
MQLPQFLLVGIIFQRLQVRVTEPLVQAAKFASSATRRTEQM